MITSLSDITNEIIISYFLVLCRTGSIIMTMPAIGEVYVSTKIRILFSLVFTMIIHSIVGEKFLAITNHPVKLTLSIFTELMIGIGIGMMVKILISSINIAGTMIGSHSGLSSAMIFDPNTGAQGSVESNFLGALVAVLIFVTDLHHLFIAGVIESYYSFHIFSSGNFQQIAENSAYLIGNSFAIAFKLASPHIIIGIILMFSAGILTRLMPNIQIFFLMLPVQILVSFTILSIICTSIILWYFEHLHESVRDIFMFR